MSSHDECPSCECAAAGVAELRAALREEASARQAAEQHAASLEAALGALRADVAVLLSAHAAQQAEPTALTSLPAPLACALLLRLSVCERARCSCVCRAWRRFIVRERSLWATLDFGQEMFSSEHLLGAALRAGSSLRVLDVSAPSGVERAVLHQVLHGAPALESLTLGNFYRKVPPVPEKWHDDDDDQVLFDYDDWDPSCDHVSYALSFLPKGAPLRLLRLHRLLAYRGDSFGEFTRWLTKFHRWHPEATVDASEVFGERAHACTPADATDGTLPA
jgi:hypothetical protein